MRDEIEALIRQMDVSIDIEALALAAARKMLFALLDSQLDRAIVARAADIVRDIALSGGLSKS